MLVDKAVWRPGSTTAIGLDNADFEQCLSSDRHLASIDSDAQEAQDAGITGTPYFVLGETNGDTIEGTRTTSKK